MKIRFVETRTWLFTLFRIVDGIDALLQIGTGAAAIALTATVANYKIPTIWTFQQFTALPDNKLSVAPGAVPGPSIYPGYALAVMCFITALQHIISFATIKKQWPALHLGFNWVIWPEYAVSAALMTWVWALLLGVPGFIQGIVYASSQTVTNLTGMYIEWDIYKNGPVHNLWSLEGFRRYWLPNGIATLATLMVWMDFWFHIGFSAGNSPSPTPWWIWTSFVGNFFSFMSFAFIFMGQRFAESRGGPWYAKWYWIFALSYRLNSVFVKLFMTWFLFGGTINRV